MQDRRGVVFFLGVNLKLRYSSPPVHNLNAPGGGKSYREGEFLYREGLTHNEST